MAWRANTGAFVDEEAAPGTVSSSEREDGFKVRFFDVEAQHVLGEEFRYSWSDWVAEVYGPRA